MRIGVTGLITTCTILAMVSSCAMYQDYRDKKPDNIKKVETRLEAAGFKKVPIDTPVEKGAVEQLPLYELNRYDSARGSIYWYVDPTVCHCLYQGDQQSYDQYTSILQQEKETAEYVNDVRPDQVVYLSPFGYAFPPPIFFGGWPVVVAGPGGFGPGRGFGGGIHSRGGGGGIHRR
jgi:hypothetical protein